MGIGIDIITTDKFKKILVTDHERWSHVFSTTEWEYAFQDDIPHMHLAGMFAAKEALMKATGKVGTKHYTSFDIGHDENDAPFSKATQCTISISHHDNLAVAVAFVP